MLYVFSIRGQGWPRQYVISHAIAVIALDTQHAENINLVIACPVYKRRRVRGYVGTTRDLAMTFFLEALLGTTSSSPINRIVLPVGFGYIAILLTALVALISWLVAVPAELHHLPRVSPYAMIWSYARRESVDSRVKRLILPFALRGEGVVLVYMLGKWGVHVLDANVCLYANYINCFLRMSWHSWSR